MDWLDAKSYYGKLRKLKGDNYAISYGHGNEEKKKKKKK